jgi:hypothetical protein
VFPHIDKNKQHKLSHKATEGIFVGYAFDCPAWLAYNPTTRSITRTSSAVFNEHWKPVKQIQMQKPPGEVNIRTTRSSSKVQPTSLSPVFHPDCVTTERTPDAADSCVSSLSTMHPTFSSDIKRISQITDSTERHYYVLNMFEKMEDANVDPEDYYDQVTDVDAHAISLTKSPEAQVYLSEVAPTNVVQVCQEINVPCTYAQAADPSNEFHAE